MFFMRAGREQRPSHSGLCLSDTQRSIRVKRRQRMARKNAELMQNWIDGTASPDQMTSILFPPPIARTLPFSVSRIEPGFCSVEMITDPETQANPMGTIHGGVLCTIADAAMGVAHWGGLEEGESFTSIDFKINFF